MLIRPEVIEAVADTLEGLALTAPEPIAEAAEAAGSRASGGAGSVVQSGGDQLEASILVFHPREKGGTPLLEINLTENGDQCSVLVQSALGIVELHGVNEIRTLEVTREAAFYSRGSQGKCSMMTVSSRGVLQVYANISEDLASRELDEIGEESLRAAVALKVFAENAQIFKL